MFQELARVQKCVL